MPDKIIITIPRKKKKPSRSGGVSRGLVRTKKKSEYLSRRRTAKGINFYDLGYWKNEEGQFETIPFLVVPEFVTGVSGSIRDIEEADYILRDDVFIGVPKDQWQSKFKRISKGEVSERYGISVGFTDQSVEPLDDLEEWTSNGLVITDASELEIWTNFQLSNNLIFSEVVKVTSVYDVNANPVSFTPSTKMDVFLCPNIISPRLVGATLVSDVIVGDEAWSASAFSHINYTFIVTPRDVLIEDENEFFGVNFYAEYHNSEDVDDYADAYETMQWQMGLPGRRGYVQYVGLDGTSGSYHWETLPGLPVGPVTTPPATPQNTPGSYPVGLDLVSSVSFFVSTPNILQAVIKQGSNWFYFWS